MQSENHGAVLSALYVKKFNEASGVDEAAERLIAFARHLQVANKMPADTAPRAAFEEAVVAIARFNTGGTEKRTAKQIIDYAKDEKSNQATRAIALASTRMGLDG